MLSAVDIAYAENVPSGKGYSEVNTIAIRSTMLENDGARFRACTSMLQLRWTELQHDAARLKLNIDTIVENLFDFYVVLANQKDVFKYGEFINYKFQRDED